jgi:hypothetical protein
MRLWGDTMTQAGLAPDFVIAARRQQQVAQLLRHQNADGGFASLRGGDSTMEATAAALTALGPDASDIVKPAKDLAIGWIRQRLANTWFDASARAPRAAAYAALAAADAIDAASLHYFSDTSATSSLPAIAEANIAAAFKHIHDPNAAAFWIKKMLDEDKPAKTIPLLNALAATDALSSDDVHAAMAKMTDDIRKGAPVDPQEAAGLLRAIATDNADAGKGRVLTGDETRAVSGVLVIRMPETAASASNGDAQPLSVTYVAEGKAAPVSGPAVTRHIYRMNGVELSPPAKPMRGEIYMVELKGAIPDLPDNAQLLLQDGDANALRPVGCPLSMKMDAPAFIPWFTTGGLTPLSSCEFSVHELSVVLAPASDDVSAFSVVYFAHIDAASVTDIPPARLRLAK